MKKYTLLIISTLLIAFTNNLHAQDTERPSRKGDFLLETGYNLIAGFEGGSGMTVFIDEDGETITSLGFEGGYFVGKDFALKLRFGLLDVGGSSISNFLIGPKYYIAGKVPVELGFGSLSGSGTSNTIADLSVGYGIRLASNINLEPSLGVFVNGDNSSLIKFGLNFAMFL